MLTTQDIVKLHITEQEIKDILKVVISKEFNKRDNLRDRHPNVQFDCLLRGYIGELGIKKWFASYGIVFDDTKHSYDDEGNIDIDLFFKAPSGKEMSLEIKTSLIPDYCCHDISDDMAKLQKAIELFDIKLIRRNGEAIEELKGDIHLQIYYVHLRQAKDNVLKDINFGLDFDNINDINEAINRFIDMIYDKMFLKAYINKSFLVAWIDKPTLIKQINHKMPIDKVWTFRGSKREFWSCNLQNDAKKPNDLIGYLKAL